MEHAAVHSKVLLEASGHMVVDENRYVHHPWVTTPKPSAPRFLTSLLKFRSLPAHWMVHNAEVKGFHFSNHLDLIFQGNCIPIDSMS